MKVKSTLLTVPIYLTIGFCVAYLTPMAFVIPCLLYIRSITSSFDKYKYALLAVSKFKEVFLDKGLELYDWQIKIIGEYNLNNQPFKLMDLNLNSEQIDKAKEIVRSVDEKMKSNVNKIIIVIVICVVIFVLALSFVFELYSNRVEKESSFNETKNFDIKGENILNAFILKPFWPDCCVKFFETKEVNSNIMNQTV